jgi:hypothetical protein
VDREKYKELKHNSQQYNKQFSPENALVGVEKLKEFEPDLLKSLLQELKSTKNALLIEEKRYSNPIDIAYRD